MGRYADQQVCLYCCNVSIGILLLFYVSFSKCLKPNVLTDVQSPEIAFLCFRLVSPSRLAVSMWHTLLGSDVWRSNRSAGTVSLETTLTKSPTRTSFQRLSMKRFSFLYGELSNINTLCG